MRFSHLLAIVITFILVLILVSLPSVSVISPNGGGTWSIGEEKVIQLRVSNAPVGSYLQISLEGGPTPSDIKGYADPNGDINFSYKLPTYGCRTDYCDVFKAGSYKIKAALLDRRPCAMCFPDVRAKLLTSDSSDASFTIN